MRSFGVRAVAIVVALATGLQTGYQPASAGGSPATGLPSGAVTEAPKQRTGSAGGLDPHASPASTRTALRPAARKPVRPRGAVPDRVVPPPVRSAPPAKPVVIDRPPMRLSRPGLQGSDRRTSSELTGERTATSRTYRNADGTRTTRFYSSTVNVRRPDGTWLPIDLTLARSGDRLEPRTTPYDVSFAGGTGGELGTLRLDDTHELGFVPVGSAAVEPSASGADAIYRDVWRDADLVLRGTTEGGIKENVVLSSAAAPTSYEFRLRLRGLTPALDRTAGGINLTDEHGTVRAVIPHGWMRDAAGATSTAVRYMLAADAGSWRLRITLDAAWMRSTARRWPVTVDPTALPAMDGDYDDTYVTKGAPGNHSGEDFFRIGNQGGGLVSAGFLHFNSFQSQLPNKYVNGATLNLVNVESPTCTAQPVDVFAVGVPWDGATLSSWPGPALGAFQSQQKFAYGHDPGCRDGGRAGFPLDPKLATEWTHGTPFYGLAVRAANEGDTAGYKRFAAANVNNVNRPYLDVVYSDQGASYLVDEVTLPTNTREGRLKATVRNLGSSTWTPGGQYKLGYVVKQNNAIVQVSPTYAPPRDVAPGQPQQFDIPMGTLPPGDYQVYLTMYDGPEEFQVKYGVPYGAFALKVSNVPPSVVYEQPGSGAQIGSLNPTLYVEGKDDDNWPNTGLKYDFLLCEDSQLQVGCVDSNWTGATWTPPAGKLRWSKTYYWKVRAHDNVDAGPWVGPLQLRTVVPQPQITSHLGGVATGTDAPGLDPQVGNFTMASTDSAVATVGPDLTITRTYNSLDPRRDTAFGSGWSSRLDTSLVPDLDGKNDTAIKGNVVVTLPSGRQVRFGQNPDGSYAAPEGQNLTLVYKGADAQYTLRDAGGSTFVFNAWGRLSSITDPDSLTEQLEYDVAGPSGKPKSLYNTVSRRRLYLTWTGDRVTKVQTDAPAPGQQPLAWTYSYDGAKLAAACDPGPAPNCTNYQYQTGSRYRSTVLDDNPRAYWRLGEQNQSDGANSATARKPGADRGTYHGVVLGSAGAAGGTADTSAGFDGQSSYVALPDKLISPTMSLAVELWFRSAGGSGVLLSSSDVAWGTPPNLTTPILYVGQDGHLRGGFAATTNDAKQIVSADPVNDGRWHHAVLSGFVDTQALYLDGVAQAGTISGPIHHDKTPYLTLGSGQTHGWSSGNDGDFYFAGNIDEVAVYQHALGATAVGEHFRAGQAIDELDKVTLPQDDRLYAAVGYDDVNDRVATLTDHEGRQWRLDTPVVDTVADSTRPDGKAVRSVTLHGPYPDKTWKFDADRGGRPESVTSDTGTRTTEYNDAGFPSATIDENGHKATYTTDARGNVLSVTTCRAAGSCQTSYATYYLDAANPLDPRNDRKTSQSDARSSGPDDTTYRTTFGYDARGRLISATYPKPYGVDTPPTETWTYSTGSEPADGDGNVPAGLLIRETGKRAGQLTTYGYRSTGDLALRTDPSGLRTRYDYDLIGRRSTVTTMAADGGVFGITTTTYDARSRVRSVTSPAVTNRLTGVKHTLVTTYDYDANGNTTTTTLSDATGNDPARATSYSYDGHDALAETTFPDGTKEKWAYADAGRRRTRTDARGYAWTTITDARGRTLQELVSGSGVDPDDGSATILMTLANSYDPAGRLATSRDAIGRETRYTYFDDDRLATTTRIGVRQADGSRRDVVLEQRQYDAAGNVTKSVASGNRVTTTDYDAAGYPRLVTQDPSGLARVTSYKRDPDGQVNQVSRSVNWDPVAESTSYAYNAAGQLIREDVEATAGNTLSTTYIRDERGLVTEQDDRRRLPTNFEYDALGRLVSTIGPERTTWVAGQQHAGVRPATTTGRNTFGEPTQQRDPNGAVSTLAVDVMGRSRTVQLPDYTPPGGAAIHATVTTDYDPAGNVASTTDPLGHVTTATYDAFGRVTSRTAPKVGAEPSTTTMRYDRAGELATTIDPTGATVERTYDELGHLITSTAVERVPANGYFVTTYGYDDAGNQTTVRTPGGAVTTTAYNAAGEPTSVTDPTGRVTRMTYDRSGRRKTVSDPAGVVTRTDYDLIGRPVATVQLTGNPLTEQRRTEQTFDPDGNVLTLTSAEGRLRTFTYDAGNQLVKQVEKVSGTRSVTTLLGYDAGGHRTRFTDGKGNATDYTFTPGGLPEATIEPSTASTPNAADRTYTTVYDAAGRVVRDIAPGSVVTVTSYDEQDRKTRQTGTGAEAPTVDRAFGYDPAGRVTSFDAPGGRTTLKYDDRGQLLELHGASGEATFGYDADGRMTSRTDASGSATFGYDLAGRVTSTIDGLMGRTVNNSYDAAGRLAASSDTSASQYVRRQYGYDALGRLTADKLVEDDPTIAAQSVLLGTEYGYDKDDKIVRKSTFESNTEKVNSYGYDGAGRLTSWTGPGGGVTTYDWDDAGNRSRAGSTNYTYDERHRLTSDGFSNYTYTKRGTLSAFTGADPKTLSFDAFDRMARDGAVAYAYDSLDRVGTRDTAPFKYGSLENDVVSDGTRLISRDPSGDPFSDKPIAGTTTAKMLYADQHGDITGRYRGSSTYGKRTFDPFGKVTSAVGTDLSSLGYQGEWTDGSTGSVNMAARWYAPAVGGFTARDSWDVAPLPSAAANRYAYGAADPVSTVDESGHSPCVPGLMRFEDAEPEYGVVFINGGMAKLWERFGPGRERLIRPGADRCVKHDSSSCVIDVGVSVCGRRYADTDDDDRRWHHCQLRGCDATPRPGGGKSDGKYEPGYRYIPPPPPLWRFNLDRPTPRRPPGTTVAPRPTSDPAWSPLTWLIDRAGELADALTHVVDALETIADAAEFTLDLLDWIREVLPPGDVDQAEKDRDSCLSHGQALNIPNYWDLDPFERATGAEICLDRNGLVPGANDLPGYKADPNAPVADHERGVTRMGHLIAASFGGSGRTPQNLVPLYPDANQYMYNQFERCVAEELKYGDPTQIIHVTAVPYYSDESGVPNAVVLSAIGNKGYRRTLSVINQPDYKRAPREPYCR